MVAKTLGVPCFLDASINIWLSSACVPVYLSFILKGQLSFDLGTMLNPIKMSFSKSLNGYIWKNAISELGHLLDVCLYIPSRIHTLKS